MSGFNMNHSSTTGAIHASTGTIGDLMVTGSLSVPRGTIDFNVDPVYIGPKKGTMSALGCISIGENNMSIQTQNANAISIGTGAGNTDQGMNSVAVGAQAGATVQGMNSVAVGANAGETSQDVNSVAVGAQAGEASQGQTAIAVGHKAGRTSQGITAIAVGSSAGLEHQGQYTVAIGASAGSDTQSEHAVAIGASAGAVRQGENAIAIGYHAGQHDQHDHSIVISATGLTQETNNENQIVITALTGASIPPLPSAPGFFVAPIATDTPGSASIPASLESGLHVLMYNPVTKEIVYATNPTA